jgi:hypothetical protein
MIRWLKHLEQQAALVMPFIWAASIWACAMSAGCNVIPRLPFEEENLE